MVKSAGCGPVICGFESRPSLNYESKGFSNIDLQAQIVAGNMKSFFLKKNEIILLSSPNWEELREELLQSFNVFLHSANYKFSLGSGSSFLVKQIIDAEKNESGRSELEKNILIIKKTPVGEVRITDGGNAPALFRGDENKIDTLLPNFHRIVHCVLPGPKSDNFEQRVERMISEAFEKVYDAFLNQNKPHFFVLPVAGINNFGYPVSITLQLYARLLMKWYASKQIKAKYLSGCMRNILKSWADILKMK